MRPVFSARAAGQRTPSDPILRARDERLEALKAVAGKLAHDFNNFLVPQFGYLTLLKDEVLPGSAGAKYAASMESAARAAESYIQSILLGMRPHRQFSPREFSVDGLINETVEKWISELPPDLELEVIRDMAGLTFFGDEKQWRNVFGHLLANARFALATGGRLEIRLTRQTLPVDEAGRLGIAPGEVFKLEVRDNGFGMTPETAARAFEPFFTARTQVKAAGLGLTIVHGVTQFHGGQVELQTSESAGTVVTLWVPLVAPSAVERLASVGGTLKQPPAAKKRALLLEDDPFLREVLRAWILDCNLEPYLAENAAEASRMLQRNPSDWLLVVTDARLRTETGADVHARLANLIPHARWIILTGRDSPRAGSLGPNVFPLKKPFSADAFRALAEPANAPQPR